MTGLGYRRATKKRPCSICGKPDWCSTTATETISFCARSTLNADRVSRYGWGVFYHQDSGFDLNFNRTFYGSSERTKPRLSKPLAPPAIRDRVYRKLIELSPASSNYEIVNGRGGLSTRGIQDYSQYGSLPKTAIKRRELVERLDEVLAKEGNGKQLSFAGIPGFWRDTRGTLRLWSEQDSLDDLMLIPFIGSDGFIRACQIRFMRYVANSSGRYVWLSSAKERTGCGPGAPLHHARPGSWLNKPVLVTEGALKAATVQSFLPDRYVVGNSGVATSHLEIIKTARKKILEIAFDADCFTNPHVARALASLIALRVREQQVVSYDHPTRILAWDKRFKGIDDALIAGATLKYLNVSEWLRSLTPECFEAARHQLAGTDH